MMKTRLPGVMRWRVMRWRLMTARSRFGDSDRQTPRGHGWRFSLVDEKPHRADQRGWFGSGTTPGCYLSEITEITARLSLPWQIRQEFATAGEPHLWVVSTERFFADGHFRLAARWQGSVTNVGAPRAVFFRGEADAMTAVLGVLRHFDAVKRLRGSDTCTDFLQLIEAAGSFATVVNTQASDLFGVRFHHRVYASAVGE